MTDFDVSADGGEEGEPWVCLGCGTPYDGDLADDYTPFYVYCGACGKKTHFGTEEQYEQQ